MKRIITFIIFAFVLGIVPSYAAPYGGGIYGGGIGMRQPSGMYGGMYGRQNNCRRPSGNTTYYYYRPVEPIPPNYDKNGVKTPPQTISCLGTSSYVRIGNTSYACNSAAATRIKVKYKNNKVSSSNNRRYGM